MRKKKIMDFLKGKGYYIALILCAVAIGISGYLYYRNTANEPDETMQSPDMQSDTVLQDNIQTGVTTPGTTTPGATDSGDATEPVETTPPRPVRPERITRPVAGDITLDYAMEVLSYNPTTRDWRVHNGIDIAAEAGTEVCAAADGTVYTVYEDDGMGMTVVIRHDGGYITRYSSLSQDVTVAAGDAVGAGDVIGTVGCTALLETAVGDHLHFSVTCNGEDMDPNDFLNMN